MPLNLNNCTCKLKCPYCGAEGIAKEAQTNARLCEVPICWKCKLPFLAVPRFHASVRDGQRVTVFWVTAHALDATEYMALRRRRIYDWEKVTDAELLTCARKQSA